MSLINQMLKDLDARHEADTRGSLHREIRALPSAERNSGTRIVLAALAVLALASGGWWGYMQFADDGAAVPVLVAAPAEPSPAVVAAVASPVSPASPAPDAAAVPPVSSPTASPAASVALDEATGLKMSSLLDWMPSAEPAAVPSPAAPAVKRAAPPVSTVAAKPAKPDAPAAAPADGSINKQPSTGKGGRERAEADYRRAVALVNGARVQEATDLLLDVLRHDGGHVASRQLVARLLIEQRRYDEAMALLAEGLTAQPGQVAWAMTLARLQMERGDPAAAARTLLVAQPYAAANADYQGFAGFVQLRLGHAKESVEYYQHAVRAASADGRWWLGLGLALEADQRVTEAREAFLRARATGSLNADLAAVVDQKLR